MEEIMSKAKIEKNFATECLTMFGQFLLFPLTWLSYFVEAAVSYLVHWYEKYVYNVIEFSLSPRLAKLQREIKFANNQLTIFDAINLIYFRTLLIIPFGLFLKYDFLLLASGTVLLNGLLDQIDLPLGRLQKKNDDEQSDDRTFEEFLDSFCNKFINVLCLWTILQKIQLDQTSLFISVVFVLLCYTTIIVEILLAIVTVQNYFYALLSKKKKYFSATTSNCMENHLKEMIESIGMTCLCLSLYYLEPFQSEVGAIGILSLFLTVRFGYISLKKTFDFQIQVETKKKRVTIKSPATIQKTIAVFDALFPRNSTSTRSRAVTFSNTSDKNQITKSNVSGSIESVEEERSLVENRHDSIEKLRKTSITRETVDRTDSTSSSEIVEEPTHIFQRSASLPAIWIDGRADKVYTIGCFDLFHDGHRILLNRMRQFGREVIVGVHDSRSIFKLKSRVPVDGTETRMLNVRRYADQVFCVAGTDPSNFIKSIVFLKENETAVYIRGDDMANFPSRHVVEELMPVKFLPYTSGVSSTQLRKELFSHIQADDVEHLERVN